MTDLPVQSRADDASGPRIVEGVIDADELTKAARRAVTRALAEDLGDRGDVTSRATVPAAMLVEGEVVAREQGVVSGLAAMIESFATVDGRIHVEVHTDNASRVIEEQVIAVVHGPARSVLAAERTALNFLGHLSGIATETQRLQALLEGTGVVVRDTRKTTPGLRLLEKAAVRDGGGGNHRIGLYDAILVKDNHIQAAGGIAAVLDRLREVAPDLPIQVEVEDVTQLRELLDHGITDILLDNFSVDEVRHAVARVDGRAALEVSGGITAETIREYAEALGEGGRIAVGALTHSAKQLDVALDVVEAKERRVVVPVALRKPTEPAAETLAPPAPTAAPVEPVVPAAAAEEADEDSSASEPSVDEAEAPIASVRPKRRRISSFFSRDEESEDDGRPAVAPPADLAVASAGAATAAADGDDAADDEPEVAEDAPVVDDVRDAEPVAPADELGAGLPAGEGEEPDADEPANEEPATDEPGADASDGREDGAGSDGVEDSPVVHVTPPTTAGTDEDATDAVVDDELPATGADAESASSESEPSEDSEPAPLFGDVADRIKDAEVEGEPFAWRRSGGFGSPPGKG